jgi:hypothetical protein
MYTQAEILTAVGEQLGDVSALATDAEKIRWFNDAQARIGWFGVTSIDVTWAEGDRSISLPATVYQVEEMLYADSEYERRWEPVTGALVIYSEDGARADGGAAVLVRTYWPEVTGAVSSSLPRAGDAACISYVLHRFFRKLVANRALFQRYATLIGSNGVRIEDLSQTSDDHYSDFLDLRGDLPDSPVVTFYPNG